MLDHVKISINSVTRLQLIHIHNHFNIQQRTVYLISRIREWLSQITPRKCSELFFHPRAFSSLVVPPALFIGLSI